MGEPVSFLDTLRFMAQRPAEIPLALGVFSLVWAFFTATCVGSFLNVVIARVPEGLSVVKPRSRCPKCGTMISARDNIPLASWIVLRGKCRTCQAPISARYPFVELLIGLFGMAFVANWGWSLQALESFTFATILVAIAFVDLDTWTVPHPLWIALAVTGFAFGVATAALDAEPGWTPLIDRAIGAAGTGALMAAFVVLTTGIARRAGRIGPDDTAMGWGDPLILVGVGAFLGWQKMPLVLFLGSLQGAVVGIALKARGGLKGDKPVSETDDWVPPRDAVPFGPFLALGALEAAFFGDALLGRLLPALGLGLSD